MPTVSSIPPNVVGELVAESIHFQDYQDATAYVILNSRYCPACRRIIVFLCNIKQSKKASWATSTSGTPL